MVNSMVDENVNLPQVPAQANPELLFNGDAYESTFEEEWMSRFEFGGADTAAGVYESRDECVEHMKEGHVKCPYCGQFARSDATGSMICKQCGARQTMENEITAWHPG